MPSAQFSEQAALLLMTDDDDEGGAVEESAALKSGLWHDDGQIEYASALTSRSSENDEVWNKWPLQYNRKMQLFVLILLL